MLSVLVFLFAFCTYVQGFGAIESICPKNEICDLCVCKEGYSRNKDGECVIVKDDCGDPNAERRQCGDPCKRSCQNKDEPNLPCPQICLINQCACKNGYVIGPDGYCTLESDCPPNPECETNEEFGNRCLRERYCNSERKTKHHEDCYGCTCKDGYARNNDGDCVPTDQCCDDSNAEWQLVANRCPGGTCAHPGFQKCNEYDETGCQCKRGYVKVSEDNSTCIHQSECGYYYNRPTIPFPYLPPN